MFTHQNLNTASIKSMALNISKADKKTFDNVINMAVMVNEALTWWKAEGKALAKAEGYTPDSEQFAKDMYGFQKSYMYKLARAGALPQETINNFKLACDADEKSGGRPSRSLEALLKWANEKNESEGGEGEGEGEGEGDESISQKPVITFTCRLADLGVSDKNVSLRVAMDGSVITSSSTEDIEKAIAILTTALSSQK
jgi:hypothetical protein